MTTRTKPARPSGARRALGWLLGLVVVLAIVWTVGWFAIAGRIESEFERRTGELAQTGRADVDCGRREVRGFPFGFDFVCDEDVMIETDRAEIAFAGLSAHASVLSPTRMRARLEGPANVALGGEGVLPGGTSPNVMTVRADWQAAQAVVSDLFDERRLDISLAALDLDAPRLMLTAASIDAALAPRGTDLAVSLTGRTVRMTPTGRDAVELPRVFADLVLAGLHDRVMQRGRPIDPRNGVAGRIERLGFDGAGEGRFLVSGPFKVSPDGLVSGTFTIAVRDAESLASVANALTDNPARVGGVLTALGALGQPQTIDGVEMRAIELEAVDGRLPLGFITIDLPRLWGRPEAEPQT